MLNDKKLAILEAIAAGQVSGEALCEALGSSMQLISYYLDTLMEDGYIQVAKVYDNTNRSFQIVRAYLTLKGKATLDSHLTATRPNTTPSLAAEAARAAVAQVKPATDRQPEVEAETQPAAQPELLPVPIAADSIGPAGQPTGQPTGQPAGQPADRPTDEPTDEPTNGPNPGPLPIAAGAIDFAEAAKVVESFRSLLALLPEDWRQLATVYWEDLKTEIQRSDRRHPVRMKAYLVAFLNSVWPTLKQSPHADRLIQPVKALAQQLHIPLNL